MGDTRASPTQAPLDIDDGKRALSVRLFLAVFLPTALIVGGAEVSLLIKTSEISSGVQSEQRSTNELKDSVKELQDATHKNEVVIADIQKGVAVLQTKYEDMKPQRTPSKMHFTTP